MDGEVPLRGIAGAMRDISMVQPGQEFLNTFDAMRGQVPLSVPSTAQVAPPGSTTYNGDTIINVSHLPQETASLESDIRYLTFAYGVGNAT